MKQSRIFLLGLFSILLTFSATPSFATLYYFSGQDRNGIGSATMDITTSGNTLTAVIQNTSPVTTSNGNANIPGITAFGFNLTNEPLPAIISWSLTAYLKTDTGPAATSTNIGSGGTGEWGLLIGDKLEGVKLDYIPNNSGASSNTSAILYNPLVDPALIGTGGNVAYYTTAILTLDFSAAPLFSFEEMLSPYIRMQRVGDNAAGSLKLYGSTNGNGGGQDVIPEPSTILLLGAGLVGLGFWHRRRKA